MKLDDFAQEGRLVSLLELFDKSTVKIELRIFIVREMTGGHNGYEERPHFRVVSIIPFDLFTVTLPHSSYTDCPLHDIKTFILLL